MNAPSCFRVFVARPPGLRLFSLALALLLSTAGAAEPAATPKPAPRGPFASMFWTWQDRQIENPSVLLSELRDLKAAGFDGLFAMPRATRYQLYHPELIAAVKFATEAARAEEVKLFWGPDPRFAAHHIVTESGFGAEVLLTGREFNAKTPAKDSPETDPARMLLNECKVEQGRFSLRYEYPSRRDTHILTEVSIWFNPASVDRVFAYQRRHGQVVAASVRDVTAAHRFFINRGVYYVEVFGQLELPPGEWWVVAFPRFKTNMYAFDAPEHERLLFTLLDRYRAEGIRFDGFWWDEPGYYMQFGQYPISDRIYADFARKYGYDLKARLYALLLPLDDRSHFRVRSDYFSLLMDYVFGAQQRAWAYSERLFGPVRMGIHHCWHSLPDNLYHGSADPWRGLEAVDAGYVDDNAFERYFNGDLDEKLEQASYLVQAASLARFSRTGEAFYNRWGVNYGAEVPTYINDLAAQFSNQWLQHSYGTTRAIGGGRDFGPGFPNHPTWPLLPSLIEKTRQVHAITGYALPEAEIAVVYPLTAFMVGREPANDALINRVNRLVGAMPAAGVAAEALSEDFFASGRLEHGRFVVRGHSYAAVVLPGAGVISVAARDQIAALIAAGFPVHFVDEVPRWTVTGEPVDFGRPAAFAIGEGAALIDAVERLGLPSPTTRLRGAYVTTIRRNPDSTLVLVLPITPGELVGGPLTCRGIPFEVAPTRQLAIYRVSADGAHQEL